MIHVENGMCNVEGDGLTVYAELAQAMAGIASSLTRTGQDPGAIRGFFHYLVDLAMDEKHDGVMIDMSTHWRNDDAP